MPKMVGASSRPNVVQAAATCGGRRGMSPSTSLVLSTLRLVLIDMPLSALFALLVSSVLIRHVYRTYVSLIVDSYRRGSPDDDGFYPMYDSHVTYYNRICTDEDISTTDSSDLLLGDAAFDDPDRAARVMMTHGAVVMRRILRNDTAAELRDYLEGRHVVRASLPWDEKFYEEEARLALGLGASDHPVISEALRQVGTHGGLRSALRGIVGEDPSVVEISTLTSLRGAPDQGIHTDTDYFGSSLLYTRNFLHSYTLFVALQDTTADMGATTLCPGTHWCANEDMEEICLSNGAFEASSNGRTGKGFGGGMLHRGDALMFNQNVWHRGAANYDRFRPMNRVMFILTFVTRTKDSPSDYRRQGLGTYFYQRWNMWGHTYDDLRRASTVMTQPFAALRALGLWKPRGTKFGVTWIEQFAREFSNKEHFYANRELHDLIRHLDGAYGNSLPNELWRAHYDPTDPEWEPWIEGTMEEIVKFLIKLNVVAGGLYVLVRLIVWSVIWFLSSNSEGKKMGTKGAVKISILPGTMLRNYVLILLLGLLASWHVERTDLAKWARRSMALGSDGGRIEPFPSPDSPAGRAMAAETAAAGVTETTTERGIGGGGGIRKKKWPRLGPSTVPERMDVLFGTRFDAPFLASYNRVLDYHPGNVWYRSVLDSYLSSFVQSPPSDSSSLLHSSNALPDALRRLLPGAVLKQIRDRGAESGTAGVRPRFLLQDPLKGRWTVLSDDDAEEFVWRDLAMAIDPALDAAGRYLREVRAEGRFGHRRDCVMGWRYAADFADRWEEVLFGDGGLGKEEAQTATVMALAVPKQQRTAGAGRLGRGSAWVASPALRARGKPLPPMLRSEPATKLDGRGSVLHGNPLWRKDDLAEELAVGVGDRVWVDLYGDDDDYHFDYDDEDGGGFAGRGGPWLECKIVKAYHFNGKCLVAPVVVDYDGYYESVVPVGRLRRYDPVVEGDVVEVRFEDYNEEEDEVIVGWYRGTVISAHPLGGYDVLFEDGDRDTFVKPARMRKIFALPVSLRVD